MEPTNTAPAWMNDPLVRDIPERKLKFLGEMFSQSHGKSQKDMMAFMMPMLKKAKQENLSFTPQEMNAAITAIRRNSSEDEQKEIDKLLEKAKKGVGKP